jgi:hypothetical protein
MAIGLPLSKFLNGLSLFFIVGSWIVGGNYKEKFQIFFSNKIALLWCSVYFLHLLALFYTSDFNYAINDLRIKLPLLLFPLVIASSQKISHKQFFILLQIFIAATVVSSLVSFSAWIGIIERNITDARTISFLISHIRLALLICLSIFVTLYLIRLNYFSGLAKTLAYAVVIWLVIFLFILESFTGILILLSLLFLFIVVQVFRKRNFAIKLVYSFVFALAAGLVFYYLRINYLEISQAKPINLNQLETHTDLGNPYLHIKNDKAMENGNYVFLYLCTKELDSVWNKRSKLPITGLDNKDQPLRVTLFRFLTSKNLRKDAFGVASLSQDEMNAVENGITNVNYQNRSTINTRLKQIMWEISTYFQTGNPSGHSVTMRLEYFKTGFLIFKENPLLGVGTGDVNQAFLDMYDKTNSPIEKVWRLRAHNQYLTFAVSFGIFGLIWFLYSLFYPLWTNRKNLDLLYLVFLAIALLSMINEDTLETQAGVAFFAFFNSLLWFNRLPLKSKEQNSSAA